jgi:hypothetical protein
MASFQKGIFIKNFGEPFLQKDFLPYKCICLAFGYYKLIMGPVGQIKCQFGMKVWVWQQFASKSEPNLMQLAVMKQNELPHPDHFISSI